MIIIVFSVLLPCSGHGSGTASFGIGLLIQSRKGKPLPGTPLRVKMRKECMIRGITKLILTNVHFNIFRTIYKY